MYVEISTHVTLLLFETHDYTYLLSVFANIREISKPQIHSMLTIQKKQQMNKM